MNFGKTAMRRPATVSAQANQILVQASLARDRGVPKASHRSVTIMSLRQGTKPPVHRQLLDSPQDPIKKAATSRKVSPRTHNSLLSLLLRLGELDVLEIEVLAVASPWL